MEIEGNGPKRAKKMPKKPVLAAVEEVSDGDIAEFDQEVARSTQAMTQVIKELVGFQDLDNSGTEQGTGRSVEGSMTNTATHSTGIQDAKMIIVNMYTHVQHITSAAIPSSNVLDRSPVMIGSNISVQTHNPSNCNGLLLEGNQLDF